MTFLNQNEDIRVVRKVQIPWLSPPQKKSKKAIAVLATRKHLFLHSSALGGIHSSAEGLPVIVTQGLDGIYTLFEDGTTSKRESI